MAAGGIFDLSGHVALVTGGNSGIGLGFARGLARAGASVALWSRREERNAAAVTELRALGVEAAAFACDVGDEASVAAAVAATLERFGRIDSCFANAGFALVSPFLEMSLADWERVVRTNLTGVFLTFREVLKHMVARGGGGKLVGTSSIGELCGMPRQEHYAATKAAISSLVRSLAVEFGRHDIQVNAVLPGWIETAATAAIRERPALQRLNETIVHRTPLRRWGTPADLEGVAVYLASPASRFHTGDVLRVDGGYMVF